jgi:predicted nucleic acid-binding protein
LLDTNLLTRSVQPHAPEYPVATAAIAAILRRGERLCLTPQNLIEFWAVATRPISARGLEMTPAQAETELRQFQNLFDLLPDIPTIFDHWLQLILAHAVQGKQVHDARLVAVMQAHNITHLITFNTDDFRRFPEITIVHPRDVAPD